MNFITSLGVTMEMKYHGSFFGTLDELGLSRSLLSINGRVINLFMRRLLGANSQV